MPFMSSARYNNFLARSGAAAAAGLSGLFEFVSHTFTNAFVTGSYGPSLVQLRNAYATGWSDNPSFLNSSDGIQIFTVPTSGSYRITAAGSAGGKATGYGEGDSSREGYGYVLSGIFNLIAGEPLYIVVGQKTDVNRVSNQAAAGGGGSFVWKDALNGGTATLLICGAGGNGESWEQHQINDPDGQPPNASYNADTITNTDGRGHSGAGWTTDGSYTQGGAPEITDPARAINRASSAAIGGNASINDPTSPISRGGSPVSGGFGGGGSTNPYEGGGGGGFIGGSPRKTNQYETTYTNRGAVSFINTGLASSTVLGGANNSGFGYVIVEALG